MRQGMKTGIYTATAAVLGISLSIFYFTRQKRQFIADVDQFFNSLYNSERGYIENFPIYDDYATPEKEQKLRTYLFKDHIAVAKRVGTNPIQDEQDIKNLSASGELVKLQSDPDSPYYFYNVQKDHRYLTPKAAQGLIMICKRFNQRIKERKDLPQVKIAISSCIRPATYQKRLTARNINATLISTHSYGVSFDIFFDDYFVVFPHPDVSGKVPAYILGKMRRKFGFILGGSLRRQFKALLMETLIDLQEQNKIFAILERRQRCYHITVLGD